MTSSRSTLFLAISLALVASVLAQGPMLPPTTAPKMAPPTPTPSLAPAPLPVMSPPPMAPPPSPAVAAPPTVEGMAPAEAPAGGAFAHGVSVATVLALTGGVAMLFA